MTDAQVSVIIATNRGGPYLVEAVESLRAQTLQPTQIILVDDGSPGDEVRASAAVLGIDYVRQAAHGVAAARNRGAGLARGDWLAFLDDDDIWHPDRLRLQVEALHAEPDAVACASGGWYMDAAGRRFGEWEQPHASSRAILRGAAPLPRMITMTVSAASFQAVNGFDPSLTLAEDNDLALRLVAHGSVATVPDHLVGYRRHGENASEARAQGRVASDRVLTRLLRAARRDDDHGLAESIRENRRRFRAREALENLRDVRTAVSRRSWADAWAGTTWAATRAPRHTVVAAGRLVRRSPRSTLSEPARYSSS